MTNLSVFLPQLTFIPPAIDLLANVWLCCSMIIDGHCAIVDAHECIEFAIVSLAFDGANAVRIKNPNGVKVTRPQVVRHQVALSVLGAER